MLEKCNSQTKAAAQVHCRKSSSTGSPPAGPQQKKNIHVQALVAIFMSAVLSQHQQAEFWPTRLNVVHKVLNNQAQADPPHLLWYGLSM